jgi:beta-D-galactosyl-(1->4)-L-rhamnose phosphorylase
VNIAQETKSQFKYTERSFRQGKGIYLSQYRYFPENPFVLRSILEQFMKTKPLFTSDNLNVDCAYFLEAKILVLVNGSEEEQEVCVNAYVGQLTRTIEGFGMKFIPTNGLVI